MSTVQVRMEVAKETSASVHYLAQRLGITVKEVYVLIVESFLILRTLDDTARFLKIQSSGDPFTEQSPEKLPFED